MGALNGAAVCLFLDGEVTRLGLELDLGLGIGEEVDAWE